MSDLVAALLISSIREIYDIRLVSSLFDHRWFSPFSFFKPTTGERYQVAYLRDCPFLPTKIEELYVSLWRTRPIVFEKIRLVKIGIFSHADFQLETQ